MVGNQQFDRPAKDSTAEILDRHAGGGLATPSGVVRMDAVEITTVDEFPGESWRDCSKPFIRPCQVQSIERYY